MFTISKKVEKFTLLLFARPLVTCRHIYNSIGINVKGHFNLWNTTRSWRNAYLLKTEKCHFEIYFLVQQSNSKIVHIRIIKKDRKILWNKANNLNQRFMMQYEEQNWQMVKLCLPMWTDQAAYCHMPFLVLLGELWFQPESGHQQQWKRLVIFWWEW